MIADNSRVILLKDIHSHKAGEHATVITTISSKEFIIEFDDEKMSTLFVDNRWQDVIEEVRQP